MVAFNGNSDNWSESNWKWTRISRRSLLYGAAHVAAAKRLLYGPSQLEREQQKLRWIRRLQGASLRGFKAASSDTSFTDLTDWRIPFRHSLRGHVLLGNTTQLAEQPRTLLSVLEEQMQMPIPGGQSNGLGAIAQEFFSKSGVMRSQQLGMVYARDCWITPKLLHSKRFVPPAKTSVIGHRTFQRDAPMLLKVPMGISINLGITALNWQYFGESTAKDVKLHLLQKKRYLVRDDGRSFHARVEMQLGLAGQSDFESLDRGTVPESVRLYDRDENGAPRSSSATIIQFVVPEFFAKDVQPTYQLLSIGISAGGQVTDIAIRQGAFSEYLDTIFGADECLQKLTKNL